jgi:hypothetical protein
VSKGRRKDDGFLNVDLELESKADLSALLETFGNSIVVLRHTVQRRVYTVWLEHVPEPRHVDEAIMQYAKLVNRLPLAKRSLWDDCRTRRLNIGVQAMATNQRFALSDRAVIAVAAIRAEIVLTVYGKLRKLR